MVSVLTSSFYSLRCEATEGKILVDREFGTADCFPLRRRHHWLDFRLQHVLQTVHALI